MAQRPQSLNHDFLQQILLQIDECGTLVPRLRQQVELIRKLITKKYLADFPADTALADSVAAAETIEDLQRALGPADRARANTDRVVVVDDDEIDAVLRQIDRAGKSNRAGADNRNLGACSAGPLNSGGVTYG